MYKYPKFKWIRGKEEGRVEMEVRVEQLFSHASRYIELGAKLYNTKFTVALSPDSIYNGKYMSMPVDERHRIGVDTFFPLLKSRRHQ